MRSLRPAFITLGMAAMIAATACAAPPAAEDTSNKPVEILYAYDNNLGGPLREVLATMTAVQPPTLTIAGDTYNDVMTRLAADRTAGTLPDIAMIGLDQVGTVVDAGIATLIDDLVAADDTMDAADFDPAAMSAVTVDGATYGLPCMGTASPILYYNADIFTAAGLDPDAPPTTWSEVIAASTAIVENGAAAHGIFYLPNSYLFQSSFFSNGGQMMDPDRTELTLDSPQAAGVLDYYQGLVDDGLMLAGSEAVGRDSFSQGQTAMLVNSSSGVNNMASNTSFDLRTGVFPIPDSGARTPVLSGNAFIVVTQDPQRRLAAFEVMAHMCTTSSSAMFGSATGYTPLHRSALETVRSTLTIDNAGFSQTEHLTPWFTFPGENGVQITTEINTMIEAVTTGGSVPETLRATAEEIQALLP